MKITRALLLTPVAAMLNIGIANASSFLVTAEGTGTYTMGYTLDLTGPLSGTDLLSLTVSGQPTLQNQSGEETNTEAGLYGVNAAGVVTLAGEAGYGVGTALPADGYYYGALLISLNGGISEPFFEPDSATGLGSLSPPLSLTNAVALSSLFPYFSAVSNPTSNSLHFTVFDTDYNNNLGAFTVSASVVSAPEIDPASAISALTLFLGGLAVLSGAPNRRLS